jgi:SAM-dependent methyltransferase
MEERLQTAITSIYQADLKRCIAGNEFPVTSMSSDLATAIEQCVSESIGPNYTALDIGTGSGLHAAACLASGIERVWTIDISSQAIELAKHRFVRIRDDLHRLVKHNVLMPEFYCADFASLPWQPRRFNLVVANPPSFFFGNDKVCEEKTPLWYALYDGFKSDAFDPTKSFLYRLFDTVIRNSLEYGGTVLCMWPAIERRLTSSQERGSSALSHPAKMLRQWFGWRVDGGEFDVDTFYSRTSFVTGYGAVDPLVSEVLRDISMGCYYSDSITPSANMKGFTFRYGVFRMKREDEDRFRFVPM